MFYQHIYHSSFHFNIYIYTSPLTTIARDLQYISIVRNHRIMFHHTHAFSNIYQQVTPIQPWEVHGGSFPTPVDEDRTRNHGVEMNPWAKLGRKDIFRLLLPILPTGKRWVLDFSITVRSVKRSKSRQIVLFSGVSEPRQTNTCTRTHVHTGYKPFMTPHEPPGLYFSFHIAWRKQSTCIPRTLHNNNYYKLWPVCIDASRVLVCSLKRLILYLELEQQRRYDHCRSRLEVSLGDGNIVNATYTSF